MSDRIKANKNEVRYPTLDAATNQYIVFSDTGVELFRSPEKYLAVRFRMQELKRRGDKLTKEAGRV